MTERDSGVGRPVQVVGVIDDVRFGSPREPLEPNSHHLSPPGYAWALAALR